MSLASVDVAVLCGGLGTRLGLPDKPKCLAPINGYPYLFWLFRKLRKHGARHVVLCAGHKGEQVIDYVSSVKHGLEVDVVIEPEQKGTAAALFHARERLNADAILAINGDTMTDYDLCEFLFRAGMAHKELATLVARVDGTIGGDFAGHYGISRSWLAHLPEYVGLQDMFHRNARRTATIVGGSYIDIGTPATLKSAGAFFERACK